MASKFTLNKSNLQALGADRLADLVLQLAAGNGAAKRRLRMELTGRESPEKLANAIRKHLNSIASSDRFVGWQSLKVFRSDLESQWRLIVDTVGADLPTEALELGWLFIDLSNSVLERTTDPSGGLLEMFRTCLADLAGLAQRARREADLLDHIVHAAVTNHYGQVDGLVRSMASLLTTVDLRELERRLKAASPSESPRQARARLTSKWRRGRTLEREEIDQRPFSETIRLALEEVYDALGDVDDFIALQKDPAHSGTAARIAGRLLKAGRADEALACLDRVSEKVKALAPPDWQAARLDALSALGRHDQVQAERLDIFRRNLNAEFLRSYLKDLPDFEDFEAEESALDYVCGYGDATQALRFLVSWPSLDRADQLVRRRSAELDGNEDKLLVEAASKLMAKYPLAAIMVLRKVIDHLLDYGDEADLEFAGHRLADIIRLNSKVADWDGAESAEGYMARLRRQHPARLDFWRAAE